MGEEKKKAFEEVFKATKSACEICAEKCVCIQCTHVLRTFDAFLSLLYPDYTVGTGIDSRLTGSAVIC